MPLPTNLTTNEVKNAAGVEIEFSRVRNPDGSVVFKVIPETPSQPHELKVQHQEIGTGASRRRRSNIRIDKTVISDVDVTKPVVVTASLTLDIPVGLLGTLVAPKDVLAEMMSFIATTGAATTVLFDCTGNGASALANGTL